MSLRLAQTHVIATLPATVWKYASMDEELHLVGNRAALAIVEFGGADVPATPRLRFIHADIGAELTLDLDPPSSLPPTYGDDDPNSIDDGSPYSTTAYSVLIPAEHIAPRLTIWVKLDDDQGGDKLYNLSGHIGSPQPFRLITAPFYFYGANETTMKHAGDPLTQERVQMDQEHQDAFYACFPVSQLLVENRPKFTGDLIVRPGGLSE